MSFTVFLGNLPTWVTTDDIQSWLTAENLVADNIKVIRNPETQESKGFAFIDAPNAEEMQSIIKRFDRAPLGGSLASRESRPAPKGKGAPRTGLPLSNGTAAAGMAAAGLNLRRRGGKKHRKGRPDGPPSAFAEELAKASLKSISW